MDGLKLMDQPNLIKFYGFYFRLAQSGNAYAQSYVAQANYWGWGCAQNFDAFVKWDTMAAQNGVVSSGRRMFLYYLSQKDYDTAGVIYDNQNPSRHDPNGHNNPGGDLFGDNWFYHEDREKFIDFSKSYSNVFEFIDAMAEFKEWGEEHSKKRLADDEAREYRNRTAQLLRAICYIFGFGTGVNYMEANNCLLKNYEQSMLSPGLRYGIDSVIRDHANYMCSIQESFLMSGNIDVANLFKRGGWLSNNIVEKLDYENIDNPNLIEFFSCHAVIFALMGNSTCAAFLGSNISSSANSKCYLYFYHDDQESQYWYRLSGSRNAVNNNTNTYNRPSNNAAYNNYTYNKPGNNGDNSTGCGTGCVVGIIIFIIFLIIIW